MTQAPRAPPPGTAGSTVTRRVTVSPSHRLRGACNVTTGSAAASGPAASVGGRLRRSLRGHRGQLGGLEHTAAPGEVALVVARAVERRERDAVRGSRGMDEPPVPEIQAGVVDGRHARLRALGPEEDEVAALELVAGDAGRGARGHVVRATLVHRDRVAEVHLHDVEAVS